MGEDEEAGGTSWEVTAKAEAEGTAEVVAGKEIEVRTVVSRLPLIS